MLKNLTVEEMQKAIEKEKIEIYCKVNQLWYEIEAALNDAV